MGCTNMASSDCGAPEGLSKHFKGMVDYISSWLSACDPIMLAVCAHADPAGLGMN